MRYGSAKGSNGQFTIYYHNRINVAVQFSDGVSIRKSLRPTLARPFKRIRYRSFWPQTQEIQLGLSDLASFPSESYGRADGAATAKLDALGLTIYSESAKVAPVKQVTSGF